MLPESDGHVSIVCLVNGWVRTVSIDGTCCITLRTFFSLHLLDPQTVYVVDGEGFAASCRIEFRDEKSVARPLSVFLPCDKWRSVHGTECISEWYCAKDALPMSPKLCPVFNVHLIVKTDAESRDKTKDEGEGKKCVFFCSRPFGRVHSVHGIKG